MAPRQSAIGVRLQPPSPRPIHLHLRCSDHKAPFLAGVKACLAVLPGVASFGMICGAAMVAAGLSRTAATAMTLLTFAGTMQLAAVQLAASGAPLVVIALAGIIINLRFVMFSLSISRYFRGLPARARALFAYALSDNGYAHAITQFTRHPDAPGQAAYYLGCASVIWSVWTLASIAGIFAGAAIPREWQLEFTASLTFVALGVANMRDRAGALAAVSAGATALLTAGLPYRVGLILGAVAGVATGLLVEKWIPSSSGR
jgi:predicted branched-subunit amino acid permease